MIKKFMAITLCCLSISSALAGELFDNFKAEVGNRWNNAMEGKTDIYLPLHTWHNRSYYSREKIDSYNETPWGLGYGKSYIDEKGNWHGFFAMAFADSHNKIEPMIGYGHTKNWYTDSRDWSVGAGYTLFVTARDDIANYFPIPGIAPIASVGYKDFTLNGTYILGKQDAGNVAFIWGRYSF